MFPTEEGTPQGGIISPTLANMTLDGLQKVLAEKYKRVRIKGKLYSPMVNLVRYADDLNAKRNNSVCILSKCCVKSTVFILIYF